MNRDFVVLTKDNPEAAHAQFAFDVCTGLRSAPKCLSSKYFYDAKGTELWEQITTLPEYYLTRLDTKIIGENADNIASFRVYEPLEVVELGAGCGQKTWHLLSAFQKIDREFTYRPIDISELALVTSTAEIRKRFDGKVHVEGLVADYPTALSWCGMHLPPEHRRLFLFFGSSIGNLTDEGAVKLLLRIRSHMRKGDGLIVGFDAFNDLTKMRDAYYDSKGVTTAFNLNLLERINRELDGNFNLNNFRHTAFYDPSQKAMVSWLVATERQIVTIRNAPTDPQFEFQIGEGIQLEMSRKYSKSDIATLAEHAQLVPAEWMDGTDEATGCSFTECLFTPI